MESNSSNITERRLWVGNLDPRINDSILMPNNCLIVFYRYHLLKIMQKHGNIEKFDLLFYRTGPQAGQPRGYAFITYAKIEDAVTAKEALHNKLVGNKRIVVKWAHNINDENKEKQAPHLDIPVLSGAPKAEKRTNRETQIQAIEAKLKFMKRSTSPAFEIKPPVATSESVQITNSLRIQKVECPHRSEQHYRRRLQTEKRRK